jgi:hypothetical protein
MVLKSALRTVTAAAASVALSFCVAGSVKAVEPPVLPGYDLFQTQDGTSFDGIPFIGVPLGTYNFGGSIGVQNTGFTDTIIQRLTEATAPSTTVSLQMDALQLETAAPTNLGAGVGNYFITLQSVRGGPASTGTMTVNFNGSGTGGTFTSALDVNFDVRFGSLTGPIVASQDLALSNSGDTWVHTPTPGSVLINGANFDLNGVDGTNDFFPGTIVEKHPSGGAQHQATPVDAFYDPVPEPSTTAAMSLGFLSLGLILVARKRRTA